MKTRDIFIFICTAALACVTSSCERDPHFTKGQYLYENKDLIYVNELVIQWGGDNINAEIKEAVQEIVASMILVDGGTFTMGSNTSSSFPDEIPTHSVTLSDFYLSKVTITQKQWKAIMGENELWSDIYGKGDDYPANFISYEQAKLFIQRLKEYSGLEFRMPTEAEWEYAACGGQQSQGFTYSGSNDANKVAWYRDNAGEKMHPSAMLLPNELGLFDMSGNLWEWCSDYYGSYTSESAINPTGPTTGTKRVVRGGSFTYEMAFSRCKTRNYLPETNQSVAVGLRLAISAKES